MNLTIERVDQRGHPIIEERLALMPDRLRIDDRCYLHIRVLEVVVYHHVLIRTYFAELLARGPQPQVLPAASGVRAWRGRLPSRSHSVSSRTTAS